MSFFTTVNTISNTVGSFAGFISGPYAPIEGVTNRITPEHWNMNLPYSFKIEGSGAALFGASSPLSGVLNLAASTIASSLFGEFQLPINPQEISQDEVFSILVTPTQKGLVAEHNGVVFKDLIISGTTGQRPTNNQSGYEIFQQLRNYFRSYAEMKKSPDQKFTQLIFINRKDNEQLVVEPVKFSMQRNKDGPFLYNYQIVLKVMGARRPFFGGGIIGGFFGDLYNIASSVGSIVNSVRHISNNFGSIVQNFKHDLYDTYVDPFTQIGLSFKSTIGQPITLFDTPRPVKDQLSEKTIKILLDKTKEMKKNGDVDLSNVILPINTGREASQNKSNALNVIPSSVQEKLSVSLFSTKERQVLQVAINEALAQPRSFYEDLLATTTSLKDDTAEKFGLGDADYNAFIGRTDIFLPSERDNPEHLTNDKIDILKSFSDAERALKLILSNDDFFKADLDNYIAKTISNYDDLLTVESSNSVDEIILPSNATLEQIAMEYLGSAERWIDLAIINNLVAPYIDSNSTSLQVKKPGDRLLIPRSAPAGVSNIPHTKTIKINENLTDSEKNLGVDLKVKMNDSTFDFVFTNNNDFELIAGGANAGQAVVIKLALEKGSLKYHPAIGVGLRIGEKVRQGIDVRDDIIRSILSDARFIDIKNLNFLQNGSTLQMSMELIVKHLRSPVPLTLPL